MYRVAPTDFVVCILHSKPAEATVERESGVEEAVAFVWLVSSETCRSAGDKGREWRRIYWEPRSRRWTVGVLRRDWGESDERKAWKWIQINARSETLRRKAEIVNSEHDARKPRVRSNPFIRATRQKETSEDLARRVQEETQQKYWKKDEEWEPTPNQLSAWHHDFGLHITSTLGT